ncbi:MAG: BTAD domain-containing putative transcriptional regulator [Caldilineaceae bacterium]
MAELDIALLGPFQIRVAGKLVQNLTLKKAQALLAYLAVEASAQHPREQLALLFWPDQPRKQAFENLRQTLFVLRKFIAVHYFRATRLDLQLNLACNPQVDVACFTHLLQSCHRHAHQSADDCLACLDRFRQATALYRGDFLEHFVLPDSAAFEEWALLKREWLRREVLTALAHLTTAAERQGDYTQASQYAWRQIELDPPHEEAHRQLMRTLALSDRRSEALAHYTICCRILADEVDAVPAQETTALYEQIRDGGFPASGIASPSFITSRSNSDNVVTPSFLHPTRQRASASPALLHNLPAHLMPLLGRDTEKAWLTKLLADPTVRLLTVLGPGGIGKTHLALAVAAEQLDHFHDGVYWVELASRSSPAAMLTAMAEALHLHFAADANLQQQVGDYLHSKHLLLLLDNFEHLLEGVDLVVDLLKRTPDLTIMVTSRVRLQVQGEQLFPVAGLAFPAEQSAASLELTDYSALQLFLQQARRILPTFTPNQSDREAIGQICRMLQGLPLGILLAAAWVRYYTPTEIAAQIHEDFDFLTSDWRDLPARHQSLRALFEHSWRLLSARERTIFPQLAVFRGGFTYAAAQAVVGTTWREIIALLDRSLVQHSLAASTAGRFTLHDVVRQYAAAKLAESKALTDEAHQRHAVYYADFLAEQYLDMGTPREAVALVAVDREAENIWLAWHWAIEHGQIDLLQRALPGLNHYCQARRRHHMGDTVLRLAAEKVATLVAMPSPPPAWLSLLAEFYRLRSFLIWMLGGRLEAEQLLHQSLALLAQLAAVGENIDRAKALTLRDLGRITSQRDRTLARQCFEESLALYSSINDPAGLVHILAFLGDLAWNMGDYRAARRWLEQGLALQKGIADLEPRASLLNLLGIVALHQGQLEEAERHQRAALAVVQSIGRVGRHELFHLGMTMIRAGRFAEGHAVLTERIRQEDKEGMRGALAAAYVGLGEACLHLGDYPAARNHGELGLEIASIHKSPRLMGDTLLLLGQVEFAESHYDAAFSCLQEGIATLRTVGQLGSLGWSLACLAYVARAMRDRPSAQRHLAEALQIAQTTGAFFPLLTALPACALLDLDEHEPVRTLELYALAARYAFVANSCWFAEVAGHPIAAVANQLPLTVVQEAQQKGRTLDLWQTAALLLHKING